VTEKLSRKIHIVRCDFAIKQRFLLIFFGLQQQTNTS